MAKPMTDREVWKQAVVSQRYTGPERRHAPDDRITVSRFAVLLVVALLGLAAVVAPWIWALTR